MVAASFALDSDCPGPCLHRKGWYLKAMKAAPAYITGVLAIAATAGFAMGLGMKQKNEADLETKRQSQIAFPQPVSEEFLGYAKDKHIHKRGGGCSTCPSRYPKTEPQSGERTEGTPWPSKSHEERERDWLGIKKGGEDNQGVPDALNWIPPTKGAGVVMIDLGGKQQSEEFDWSKSGGWRLRNPDSAQALSRELESWDFSTQEETGGTLWNQMTLHGHRRHQYGGALLYYGESAESKFSERWDLNVEGVAIGATRASIAGHGGAGKWVKIVIWFESP